MYTCGYVPLVLISGYQKRKEPKIFEDSFYDSCRKWFEEINHGGAFEVNDCVLN